MFCPLDPEFGKKMALHIRPWKLKDNKLFVMIDDDKWKQPFEEFKEKILNRMEKDLGTLTIREFSIVMQTPKKQSKKRKVKDPHPSTPLFKKSPTLNMALEAELTLIKDPSINTALRRLINKAQSFDQKGIFNQ